MLFGRVELLLVPVAVCVFAFGCFEFDLGCMFVVNLFDFVIVEFCCFKFVCDWLMLFAYLVLRLDLFALSWFDYVVCRFMLD